MNRRLPFLLPWLRVSCRCGAALAIVATLAGCQLYWTKPGADLAAFVADHKVCATKAGAPMASGGGAPG